MENKLETIKLTNEGKIKSTELVEIINVFREEEGKNPKEHSDFMKKIKKEIETLKSLGLDNEGNFSPVEYIDKKGEKRPCYELTHDGMLEMLNSESVYCRAKTIEYINKLESEIKPSYLIEDSIERAEAWIKEEKKRRELENTNTKLLEENKQKEQIIGELKPKADYTDVILKCPNLVTVSQISKDYGMSARKLNNLLHDWRIQFKQGDTWLLYAKYQTCGYTKSYTYYDEYENARIMTKWTQKGRLFLNDVLNKHNIYALIEREDKQNK